MADKKVVVMVLASKNFRDEEFFDTKSALEEEGVRTVPANSSGGQSLSKFGKSVSAEKRLQDIDPSEYDGIIFVGGSGAKEYFDDADALRLAKTFFELGKVVGAICIAPTILANSGILDGRRATAYMSEEEVISRTAKYTGSELESDGKLITCKWPTAARDFGKRIARLLGA